MKSSIYIVDVDRTDTWTRYRNGLCDNCMANCCTMPVEVRLPDLVRLELVDPFEAEHEAPKQIAKRLTKAGLVQHFNFKYEVFTLARRANGDCHFLDAQTRRCKVYDKRPNTCRKHPQIGPKPGYCPFGAKAAPRKEDAR
ncbi:MAG: YkgJ family cysteine cluster protein [Aquabacterium sp.]|uniref:YkgJ family cysteine cluster protein n=1 Tax=Aquabacterium sp. TaxID=1872578 RepID=UPI0012122AB0|nr:YkgJ family cysteine cluster protein [Aquabacterium sp.]TAK89412.1 MAG: YkgJ family cysteine cluster protein [Aquabacterium sp.]